MVSVETPPILKLTLLILEFQIVKSIFGRTTPITLNNLNESTKHAFVTENFNLFKIFPLFFFFFSRRGLGILKNQNAQYFPKKNRHNISGFIISNDLHNAPLVFKRCHELKVHTTSIWLLPITQKIKMFLTTIYL